MEYTPHTHGRLLLSWAVDAARRWKRSIIIKMCLSNKTKTKLYAYFKNALPAISTDESIAANN